MVTEADIEKEFVTYAASKGCLAVKLILHHGRGFPDRTVMCPGGVTFFIEFKKPGGKTSKNQDVWIDHLSKLGFECHVIDNIEEAKRLLDTTLEAGRQA